MRLALTVVFDDGLVHENISHSHHCSVCRYGPAKNYRVVVVVHVADRWRQ
jgi:hypothetical protein